MVKKNTKTLMDKKHHIAVISATKGGWAVGCGSRKEKVNNSMWAWVERLNKGKEW